MKASKVISAQQAASYIKDNDTVIIGGVGGGIAEASDLIAALRERFLETHQPAGLTFFHVSGVGDFKQGGMNQLALEGLVKRNIGGHYDYLPEMGKLVANNRIEAYNLPQGVMSLMFRETAAGRPGLITHVGLKTFVDPRVEGGKMNSVTKEDIVKVITIEGEDKLFYPSMKYNAALLRGTTADEDGNITMEEEAVILDNRAMAQAAHNSGGKVFVQVKRLAQRNTLPPREIIIPGVLVDGIIISPNQKQTACSYYNPAFSGEIRIPVSELPTIPYGERKIIAMRAAMEIKENKVINLGVGISGGVGTVAQEMGLDELSFLVEQGVIGGVPASGLEFGAASNPVAIIDSPSQFDFFDGGGLQLSCLGMAQVDTMGNVNVSKIGSRIFGCGGFINIAQNVKQIVFCGTFTSGGLEVNVQDGKLHIVKEGKHKKFVKQVEQITFSGEYALEHGQKVSYVTERAVFGLEPEGLVLLEIAPGVDLEKDIFAHMPERPAISPDLKLMDQSLFLG